MKTQEPVVEFDANLVAGSTKTAMKDVHATSRDLWNVDVASIHILPNFNVRVHDAAYHAHIRALANSIKAEGFFVDKPLAGYVAREGDAQVIYITDGHCRYQGALLAIAEGAEIVRLPVVVSAQGTSLEDLTVSLVKSNSGKPLSTYEVAVVCARLSRYGWDTAQIASRLDLVEVYVEGLLLLVSAPRAIREMVQNGQVAATTAIQALRTHGSNALDHLQAALNRATATGSARVTARHMPGVMFKKSVKKAAPKLYGVLAEMKSDPGYGKISPELREKIEALLKPLEDAQAEDTTEDKETESAD